jgi:hypothetical protein
MKIGLVRAELFRADRWTDGKTDRNDKVNSRFSQFCERAKKMSGNSSILGYDAVSIGKKPTAFIFQSSKSEQISPVQLRKISCDPAIFILCRSHPFSSLSYDRFKASSKASSPHSTIYSFLFQMRVSFPFLKVVQ